MLERIQDALQEQQVAITEKILASRGTSLKEVKAKLSTFRVEIPSWGFGRSGTRYATYIDGTEAASPREKLALAGLCQRLTGCTPAVALIFPWDGDDYDLIRKCLKEEGLQAGAVNPSSFLPRPGPLDYRLKWGSLTNPVPEVRRAYIQHALDCLGIMRYLDSKTLTVWLHDGTNSPGQLSLLEQTRLLDEGAQPIYDALRPHESILIEYKFFEPAFYATAIADWGRSYALCQRLGDRARVLVDLGHHPLGTNVEQIVANLQYFGKLGGFHLNDRKYADDDLTTGSVDPFQLFRIFNVLVEAEFRGLQKVNNVVFMIDESHYLKDPLEEMLEAVDSIQRAYVQALAVDRTRWADAQKEGDAEAGDQVLKSAFFDTPATTILQSARLERGYPADPLQEYRFKYKASAKRLSVA